MKKILILVDCQNDFIDGCLGSEDAQKKVPLIVDKITTNQWDKIYVTLDSHSDNYLSTKEGKKLPIKHCIYGTDGWKLNQNIADVLLKLDNVAYFHKNTFGSVEMVNKIKETYRNKEIEITMVGFCTDICVISNALMLKAYCYENANIIIDADCCAGVNKNKHLSALDIMESCQINIQSNHGK